jgi:hypothetical protein
MELDPMHKSSKAIEIIKRSSKVVFQIEEVPSKKMSSAHPALAAAR